MSYKIDNKQIDKKQRNKKYFPHHLPHALLAILVASQVAPVCAESAVNDLLDLSLEELAQIQVTVASPFRESDLVVGSTVARVTAKEWQLAGAHRTSDAIGHLPSTIVLPNVFGSDAIAIRGYAFSTRGLATVIDGVPVNNFSAGSAQFGLANFGLGALNNIEMIRGPGSAIYGSDAFHGVFALNTFEADADITDVSSGLGSEGYYQGALHDSHQLSSNLRSNIAFTVSGQGDQDRAYSYTDTSTGQPQSASRELQYGSQTGVIKLVSDAAQPWSYRVGFYWDHYDAEQFPGYGRSLSQGKSALGATDLSGNDSRFAMSTLSISRILSNQITVQLNNFYWDNTTEWSSWWPSSAGIWKSVSQQVNIRQGTDLVFKQADNAWNTQWVASIGYQHMQVDRARESGFAADGSLFSKTTPAFSGLDRSINDVFLQARTSLYDDKLQLLYGGRVDDYEDFGVQQTPRVGVILLPQTDLAFKLLYGEAFRAPIASELTNGAFTKGNPDLKPESNNTYEFIVMKREQHWKAELTFFKNHWQDGIATVPSSDSNYRLEFVNVSKNSAQGVELSYEIINNPWLVDLSASYVQSQNDLTDKDYVVFPRVILNAGFGYQLANGVQFYLNNRFFGNSKAGPITTAIPNPKSLSPYWRTDFHMGKELSEHLQLSLDIKNIFDRDNYLPSMASAEDGYLDEPLNLNLGMRYKF